MFWAEQKSEHECVRIPKDRYHYRLAPPKRACDQTATISYTEKNVQHERFPEIESI